MSRESAALHAEMWNSGYETYILSSGEMLYSVIWLSVLKKSEL